MPGASPRTVLVVVLATIVSGIGLLDAVVGRAWDFAVVFGLTLILQLVLLARFHRGRAELTVRRDLASWVAARAVATGESPEEVVDRALAMVRSGLVDETQGDP
jgi:lysylphosphatidylglycerol synthetase-like protein (DUF2156 family)